MQQSAECSPISWQFEIKSFFIPTAQAAISNDTNSYEVTNSNEDANEASIGQ